MSSVRITGLVRLADGMRRELAAGITAQRKAELQAQLSRSLASIRQILASHGATEAALPTPSRHAYAFLTSLDLNAVPVRAAEDGERKVRAGTVTFPGLPQHWNSILWRLSVGVSETDGQRVFEAIATAHHRYADSIARNAVRMDDLSRKTGDAFVWLTLFSQRAYFDRYVAAVADARAAFETALARQHRFRPPARIEFRPIRTYWQIRGTTEGTEVHLPTPMICLDARQFRQLAAGALEGSPRRAVAEFIASEAYQTIQAEWDSAAGATPATAGVHRDLAASFDRVNQACFGGTLQQPTLHWNRAFTGRKFGHYDPTRDSIMISCALDSDRVPEFVLDSVMHHELLHKKLGVDWSRGRAEAHTPQFRAEERTFPRYEEADLFLRQYAAGLHS